MAAVRARDAERIPTPERPAVPCRAASAVVGSSLRGALMLANSQPRPRECAQCHSWFTPQRMGARVCSPRCASRLVRAQNDAAKADFKKRKEALKTIPRLVKEAQVEFNKWVRARDSAQPCISCGAPPPDLAGLHAGRDAGHWRSTGAAAHLRFHEDNCHAQCVRCNQHKAGNAVEYRVGLVARIGASRVEALEMDNAPRKWTREELIEIKKTYAAKCRELKARDGR